MADTKVSAFAALTGANAATNDLVPVIDVSDISQGAGGTAKTMTRAEMFNNIAIGGTTAAAGAFTTLSASSTVSGTGFSTYLASPPAIGGTAAAAGSFTDLVCTTINADKIDTDATAGKGVTITAGTATTDVNALNVAQTWNNAAVAFTGVKLVYTDTASAAGALPLHVLGGASGTTSLFSVRKTPGINIGSTALSTPNSTTENLISFYADMHIRNYFGLVVTVSGINKYWLSSAGFGLSSDKVLSWDSSTVVTGNTVDTGLSRISAGVVGVGTGAAASFAGRTKATSHIVAAVAVGSLNASPTIGEIQVVNDASAVTAKGATVAAGGSSVAVVVWNGTNWVGI